MEKKFPMAKAPRLKQRAGCRKKGGYTMTTLLVAALAFATGWLLRDRHPDAFKELFYKLTELLEKIKSCK